MTAAALRSARVTCRLSPWLACLVAAACVRSSYVAPTPASPRLPTAVAASFERAWSAVIDVFAAENIPIATLDKDSGFIVADRAIIPTDTREARAAAIQLADCGQMPNGGNFGGTELMPVPPTSARYNIVVRPSGEASTVRVTVVYTSDEPPAKRECISKGRFESTVESRIRSMAEGVR